MKQQKYEIVEITCFDILKEDVHLRVTSFLSENIVKLKSKLVGEGFDLVFFWVPLWGS